MAEKLEDLNLPISIVTRIVKECLPNGINISSESRTAIAKAASVFVLYITSASNLIAQKNGKKTISGSDVLHAVRETEFEKFIEPLEDAFENFKKFQKEKKDATARRKMLKDDKREMEFDTPEQELMEIEDE